MKKLLLIVTVAGLAACSKNNSGNNTTPKVDTIALLTANKWKVTDMSAKDSTGKTYNNLWGDNPDYMQDDYLTLYSSGKYSVNDNAKMWPNATGPLVDTGSWNFGNQVITLLSNDPDTYNFPAKVQEISQSKLSVEIYEPDSKTTIWYTYQPL